MVHCGRNDCSIRSGERLSFGAIPFSDEEPCA
jgi:hypothetical protein